MEIKTKICKALGIKQCSICGKALIRYHDRKMGGFIFTMKDGKKKDSKLCKKCGIENAKIMMQMTMKTMGSDIKHLNHKKFFTNLKKSIGVKKK